MQCYKHYNRHQFLFIQMKYTKYFCSCRQICRLKWRLSTFFVTFSNSIPLQPRHCAGIVPFLTEHNEFDESKSQIVRHGYISVGKVYLYISVDNWMRSTSFCHSFIIWKYVRMPRNENNNAEISFYGHSIHFHFISISFVTQEWWWNDGMRVKWKIFLNQGKTLKSETHLIPPSFYHSS